MNTYAMYRDPDAGVYPRRGEAVVLRKTNKKIRIREGCDARQHERVAWEDIDNGELYAKWFGSMRHVENHLWGYGIDQMRSPLKNEHLTWRR